MIGELPVPSHSSPLLRPFEGYLVSGEARVIGLYGQCDFVTLDRACVGDCAETEDCDEGDLVPIDLAVADFGGVGWYLDRAG